MHTANIFLKLFEEEERELPEWSSNSPDLNPIKNLWAIVKQALQKPRDRQEKMEANRQKIDSDVLKNLSEKFINFLLYCRKLKA